MPGENNVNAYTIPCALFRAEICFQIVRQLWLKVLPTEDEDGRLLAPEDDRAYAAIWARPACHHVPMFQVNVAL